MHTVVQGTIILLTFTASEFEVRQRLFGLSVNFEQFSGTFLCNTIVQGEEMFFNTYQRSFLGDFIIYAKLNISVMHNCLPRVAVIPNI